MLDDDSDIDLDNNEIKIKIIVIILWMYHQLLDQESARAHVLSLFLASTAMNVLGAVIVSAVSWWTGPKSTCQNCDFRLVFCYDH